MDLLRNANISTKNFRRLWKKIPGVNEKEQKIIESILVKYGDEYSFCYYGSQEKGNFGKPFDLDVLIKGSEKMPIEAFEQL